MQKVWDLAGLGPSMGGLRHARLTFVGALTSVWVGLLPPAADMAEIQPSSTSVPPLAPAALPAAAVENCVVTVLVD